MFHRVVGGACFSFEYGKNYINKNLLYLLYQIKTIYLQISLMK